MLKVQEIREIIKLIDESTIQEFEYKDGEGKVTLKKQGGVVPAAAPVMTEQAPAPKAEPATPAEEKKEDQGQSDKQEGNEPAAEKNEETADYDYEITSPMVGTVYHRPAPEDDPYVQAGDKVTDDSVVCIVEAMKLFNEIEAEVSGEIVEVLVSDGELVEYNQPLFRVKR